eukprot:198040-Chlamydomonas_euryale.AAC.1
MGVVAYTDVTLSPPAVLPLTEMTTEGKAEIEAFLERLIFGSNHQAQDPAEYVTGQCTSRPSSREGSVNWAATTGARREVPRSPEHWGRMCGEAGLSAHIFTTTMHDAPMSVITDMDDPPMPSPVCGEGIQGSPGPPVEQDRVSRYGQYVLLGGT